MGERLGSQWEPPRTVHHAQEIRFPSARSKEPPKDLKQDVIRSCLQVPLETAENGLEGVPTSWEFIQLSIQETKSTIEHSAIEKNQSTILASTRMNLKTFC